jgi:hypothetical protein
MFHETNFDQTCGDRNPIGLVVGALVSAALWFGLIAGTVFLAT